MIGQVVCLKLSLLLFANQLFHQPEARIWLYRGGFKSACVQAVIVSYGLANGCAVWVVDLLTQNKYIYVVSPKVRSQADITTFTQCIYRVKF